MKQAYFAFKIRRLQRSHKKRHHASYHICSTKELTIGEGKKVKHYEMAHPEN